MSDPVPAMLGNSLPTDVNPDTNNPLTSAELPQSPDGEAFPKLFASFDPAATAVDETDMSALLYLENPFSPLPTLTDSTQTGIATLNNGQTGNALPPHLPSMSINGFIAHSDPNGAAAISFTGDGQQFIATTPQLASGLAPAIQQSQAQLQEGMQQSIQQSIQNPVLVSNVALANQNTNEAGKQLEILSEMVAQTKPGDELSVPKSTTPIGFSQLLSTPMAGLESASGIATVSRSMEPMTATLQQPHWNEQIGDRLNVMISRGLQQAEIRLNPPELGMLDVKIQIQGDQANVNFSTPHSQVKEALDAAIPRLREMLEENGLTLGDVNVSHQSLAQGQSQGGEESTEQTSGDVGHEVEQETLTDKQDANDLEKSGEISMLDVYV